MHYADCSRLGRPYSKDPSVVLFRNAYWMYYSIPPATNSPDVLKNVWGIGIAQSPDLSNWTKVGELLPEQPVEKFGICAPGAIVIDERVHLFYQTYGTGPKDAICHAVSDDGVHFQRNNSNPIFRPSGKWNIGRAIDADVIAVEGNLLLYYATRDPAMKIQMLGVARASLTSNFSASAWADLSVNGPILEPVFPWEQKCIEAPAVCRRGEHFFMFYAGAYNNAPQQIGVASSTDGISWKRMSDRPFLANGASGEWNSSESGHPSIFDDMKGDTWLFYQGNNDDGRTWYISKRKVLWLDGRPTLM